MKCTIRPLTPELWPAFEDLFGENGAVGGCWCMYWRIGGAIRSRPRGKQGGVTPDRRAWSPPGLLAFDGDLPSAGASSRPAMRYRGLIACGGSRVWTPCPSGRSPVFVRRGYRRRGVTPELI